MLMAAGPVSSGLSGALVCGATACAPRRCLARQQAVKQMSIARLPPVLALHIKRFEAGAGFVQVLRPRAQIRNRPEFFFVPSVFPRASYRPPSRGPGGLQRRNAVTLRLATASTPCPDPVPPGRAAPAEWHPADRRGNWGCPLLTRLGSLPEISRSCFLFALKARAALGENSARMSV